MSMPNIPDITPNIDLDIGDSAKLLFNSLALNEMGLSHIINAEGEKIQYVLGTLSKDLKDNPCNIDMDKILCVNNSVDKVLRDVLKNQMILQMKMEDTMELYSKINCCDCCDKTMDEECNYSPDDKECYDEDEVKCEAVYYDTNSTEDSDGIES